MRVWLLQSRRGGRTCGHLHVRDSGARRCRDTQADPLAWMVTSAWLSELEGARRKPDWGGLMVGVAMVILVGGIGVAAFVVLVGAALAGQVWGAVLAGVVLVLFVLLTGACVSIWLDEYRNPSPYGISWDW